MKLKDWEVLALIAGGIGFVSFITSFSFAVFGQVLAFSFGIGLIVLLFRRGIIKGKNKIKGYYEKRQAV